MDQLLIRIFELVISLPGAAIISFYYRMRGLNKSVKACMEEEYTLSGVVGFIAVALLVIAFRGSLVRC